MSKELVEDNGSLHDSLKEIKDMLNALPVRKISEEIIGTAKEKDLVESLRKAQFRIKPTVRKNIPDNQVVIVRDLNTLRGNGGFLKNNTSRQKVLGKV